MPLQKVEPGVVTQARFRYTTEANMLIIIYQRDEIYIIARRARTLHFFKTHLWHRRATFLVKILWPFRNLLSSYIWLWYRTPFIPINIKSVAKNSNIRNILIPLLDLKLTLLSYIYIEAKNMFIIKFAWPAKTNISCNENKKRSKYLDYLFDLRKPCIPAINSLSSINTSFKRESETIPIIFQLSDLQDNRYKKQYYYTGRYALCRCAGSALDMAAYCQNFGCNRV